MLLSMKVKNKFLNMLYITFYIICYKIIFEIKYFTL